MSKVRCLFVVIALLAAAGTVFADNVYVNAAAAGANDGTSWDNAFTGLQAAISTGAVIHVAAGTYKPIGDPSVSFMMENFVTIEGGWSKVGSAWVRNVAGTPTILSGDLNGDDTLYDLTAAPFPDHAYDLYSNAGGTRSDNTKIVVNCNGKYGVILDGITIRSGNNTGGSGGGIVGDAGTKLRINNCKIDNNYCNNNGGGIYISAGSTMSVLTISDSQITNNTCKNNWGGGMRIDNGCYFTLTNCTVKGNVSWDDGAGGVFLGAAICTISDCLFQKNYSWDAGGLCIRTNSGAGNVAFGLPAVTYNVSNVIFDTNWGKWSCPGSMIEMDSDNFTAPYDTNQKMIGVYQNCLFNGNWSSGKQNGALGVVCTNRRSDLDVQKVNVNNCTFANNGSAGLSGMTFRMMGICYGSYFRGDNGGGTTLAINNTILWDPSQDGAPDVEVGPNPDSPVIAWNNGFVKTTTSYCDIKREALAEPNCAFGTETGNISADPQFVVADALYNVQATSPTIDSGNPASDFSKEPACNGGVVNMGWTGNSSKATRKLAADMNCDNHVNLVDFNVMASEWLQ